jgi:hypothetical protein
MKSYLYDEYSSETADMLEEQIMSAGSSHRCDTSAYNL